MKIAISITILILFSSIARSQDFNEDYVGIYEDEFSTKLTLNSDGTFELMYSDPVFPYTLKIYENKGIWSSNENEVILNPNKIDRKTDIKIKESKIQYQDSVTLKINYSLMKFKNEELIEEAEYEFDQMTIFVNKKNIITI